MPKFTSDHNPVSVSISTNRNPKGKGYWKFPNPILTSDKYCAQMSENLCNWITRYSKEYTPDLVLDLIKWKVQGATTDFLRLDGLEDKSEMRRHATIAELHSYRDSENISHTERKEVNNEIVSQMQAWSQFLEQVGKKRKEFNIGRCIRDKEKSSKYFFRKFNAIPSSTSMLYDEQDSPQTSDEGILKISHNFYTKLYNKQYLPYTHSSSFINILNSNLIDEEDSALLGAEITLDELTTAMQGMKDGKALGLDGLSVNFYKRFWNILGPIVLESFTQAEKNGHFSQFSEARCYQTTSKERQKLTFCQ